MHWMIITTMILRVAVLIIFLPRIHEEGAETFSHTVKSITRDQSDQMHRRVNGIRLSYMRKRLRKQLDQEAIRNK